MLTLSGLSRQRNDVQSVASVLPPGTTEAENDPVYQAGMLLAQTWEVIEEVLAGKVPKDEIVKSLRKAQETVRTVVTLLKEAD